MEFTEIYSHYRPRPALTFNMIVAASQVKWNKIQTSVIATSHDGDLKLWDIRKSSTPFMYMSAHIGRIFSLDWSPQCQDSLVTSSQDCYVKFFNVNSQPSNGKDFANFYYFDYRPEQPNWEFRLWICHSVEI